MQRSRNRRFRPDSAAVGWVSNSDAFLFGMGLLLAVAMTLDRQVDRYRRQAAAHSAAEIELIKKTASLQKLLRAAREDALRLARFASDLERRLKELAKERAQLHKRNVALGDEKEASRQLKKSLESLRKRHAELQQELERTKKAQTAAAREQERIARELQAAKKALDKLRHENRELADARKRLANENAKQAKTLHEMDRSGRRRDDLQRRYDSLEFKYRRMLDDLQQIRSNERRIRTELIGLRGSTRRVAILFDSSRSMKQGGRWEAARKIVATWLEYLDMEQCVLIVFGRETVVLPDDGSMLDLRGDQGAANRQRLLSLLERLEPVGGTNTLAALETAYTYEDLDAILLFTDGAPNDGRSATFDPAIARRIYRLCEQHKDIPINTVGLGDYFQKDLSGFLMRLAEITGGTFIGR